MIVAVMIATMGVAAVVFVGAVFGIERCLDWRKPGAKPAQHVLDHVVAAHAQPIADDLHVDVAIADVPGEPRQLVSTAAAISTSGSGRAGDADDRAVFEHEAVAVAQSRRLRQVEEEGLSRSPVRTMRRRWRSCASSVTRSTALALSHWPADLTALARFICGDISAASKPEIAHKSPGTAGGWSLPRKPLWCRAGEGNSPA